MALHTVACVTYRCSSISVNSRKDPLTRRMFLDADSYVVDNPEEQAAPAWPLPVEARLESLLGQATRSAHERTSPKTLVTALRSCVLSADRLRIRGDQWALSHNLQIIITESSNPTRGRRPRREDV